MYTTHHLMMIHPCVKYDMPISKQTEVTGLTGRHIKNLITSSFKSKVKSYVDHECTRHIVLLSYGDTLMCQIWYAIVEAKNRYGPYTNLHTDNGQTYGQ